jgi:hypothetical protein
VVHVTTYFEWVFRAVGFSFENARPFSFGPVDIRSWRRNGRTVTDRCGRDSHLKNFEEFPRERLSDGLRCDAWADER